VQGVTPDPDDLASTRVFQLLGQIADDLDWPTDDEDSACVDIYESIRHERTSSSCEIVADSAEFHSVASNFMRQFRLYFSEIQIRALSSNHLSQSLCRLRC
jgi:hypothetical protein